MSEEKSIFEKVFEEIDKQLDKDREEAKEAADKSKESLKTVLKTKVEAEKDISDAIVGMCNNISENFENSAEEAIEKALCGMIITDAEGLVRFYSAASAETKTVRDVFEILYEYMCEKQEQLEKENEELKEENQTIYEKLQKLKDRNRKLDRENRELKVNSDPYLKMYGDSSSETVLGGYAQRPKCFGDAYDEKLAQCNYLMCSFRKLCREEYKRLHEKSKTECPGKYDENNKACRKGITTSAACRQCMNRMFWEDTNE